MRDWVPIAGASDFKTVAGTEVDFDTVMAAGEKYIFTSTTACYIRQGTAPIAASAGDGSMLVGPYVEVLIEGNEGPNLSVIQAAAGGSATLQKVRRPRMPGQ